MSASAQIIPLPREANQISIIRVTDTWYRGTAHDRGTRLTFWAKTRGLVRQKYLQHQHSDRRRRQVASQYRNVEQIGRSRFVRRLQPGMRVHRSGCVGVFTIAATGETRGRAVAWLNGVRGAVPIADLHPSDGQAIDLDTLA